MASLLLRVLALHIAMHCVLFSEQSRISVVSSIVTAAEQVDTIQEKLQLRENREIETEIKQPF